MAHVSHPSFFAWCMRVFFAVLILLILFLALAGAIGFGLAKIVKPAHAHDPEHPELDAWYKTLSNQAGASCCDGSDAKALADVDWDMQGDHYRVHVDGVWQDVPPSAHVKQPNRSGLATVWFWPKSSRTIQCFMPGAGG